MSTPLVISFSIVSHGQGHLIDKLLGDFTRIVLPPYEIILTLNIAEDETFIARHANLPVQIIRNDVAKGFGANHNAALAAAEGSFFAVVNPDIRLSDAFAIGPLLSTFDNLGVGLCAPAIHSSDGQLQDSARKFPTVIRLLNRKLGCRDPDYVYPRVPFEVDWVAGMFMLFRHEAFRSVDGFDERFFMYFEDADICARMRDGGWKVVVHPLVIAIHDAQRASRRDWQHLRWHVRSSIRYLTGW